MITVERIDQAEAIPWLLGRHYAKRKCPISHCFAAFSSHTMIGIVSYGSPASSPLRFGLCGAEFSEIVLELNRLCCESRKNLASIIVGRSLRLLPKPSIVVSFADTSVGHVGYVYQSTNFFYTGLTAKRTDWKVRGREHLHGVTIADEFRGQKNRSKAMRDKYGEDFYLQKRPQKHRYVRFTGTSKQKKELMASLKYPILPYPKGESKRYDASAEIETQMILL